MSSIYYPAVIDRSASGYGVSFPDFPGCIAAGTTLQEAALAAEAALALHIDGMRADGDKLPAPSAIDAIEPMADDVATILVRTEAEPVFRRVQVTIEAGLLAAIDAASPNRSAFLSEAARAMLHR